MTHPNFRTYLEIALFRVEKVGDLILKNFLILQEKPYWETKQENSVQPELEQEKQTFVRISKRNLENYEIVFTRFRKHSKILVLACEIKIASNFV